MTITRRALVTSGTALAAAGALTGQALLDWAKAWAQTARSTFGSCTKTRAPDSASIACTMLQADVT